MLDAWDHVFGSKLMEFPWYDCFADSKLEAWKPLGPESHSLRADVASSRNDPGLSRAASLDELEVQISKRPVRTTNFGELIVSWQP